MTKGVWNHATVGWIIAISLLPVLASLILTRGASTVPLLLISAATVLIWQLLFRLTRGVPFSATGLVTVLAVALMVPTDVAIWQILLAVSFGTVMGELIFGGWGRNVLSGAVVTLAFLALSAPNATFISAGPMVAVPTAAAALILLLCGVTALPVLTATAVGFAAIAYALNLSLETLAPVSGTLGFALLYFVADPIAAAVTRPGRWVYGLGTGALAALLLAGPATAPQAVVFASLLGAIFAPLIDQGAIAATHQMQRILHG